MLEKPAWYNDLDAYLTGKKADSVRYTTLPDSFKAIHRENDTEAAAVLVLLWAKGQGATNFNKGLAIIQTQRMVIALGIESAAAEVGLDLGERGWPVADLLKRVGVEL